MFVYLCKWLTSRYEPVNHQIQHEGMKNTSCWDNFLVLSTGGNMCPCPHSLFTNCSLYRDSVALIRLSTSWHFISNISDYFSITSERGRFLNMLKSKMLSTSDAIFICSIRSIWKNKKERISKMYVIKNATWI